MYQAACITQLAFSDFTFAEAEAGCLGYDYGYGEGLEKEVEKEEDQAMAMKVVNASTIREILTYPLLTSRLRDSFAHLDTFCIPTTWRHALCEQEGESISASSSTPTLLLMPAWSRSPRCPYLLVKSVTVFPENGTKGLPAVAGTYILSSSETGIPLAVMDGTELILWRTACASALAADYLARKDAKVMVMVGAGALAPHLIKAHLHCRPSLEKILVWNRNHETAEKLVARLRSWPLLGDHVVMEAVTDLESSVRAGNLISCATLATEPLVLGSWLTPGTHLDLVGSFTPLMRECDDATVKRARVVVDTLDAVEKSGDLTQPIQQRVISREHILGTLADLVQGNVPARMSPDEITLYKSVGYTVADLTVAQIVYEQIIEGQAK